MVHQTQPVQKTVPTTIKIGEVEYSVTETPALRELVASVASIEKDKLYNRLEDANRKYQDLEKRLQELAQATPQPQSQAQSQSPTTSSPSPSSPASVYRQLPPETSTSSQEITPDMLRRLYADMLQNFNTTLEEKLTPIINTVKGLQEESLDEYRSRRIAESGDTIVPELVRGSNKSEIDNSLEESKKVRQRYLASQSAAATQQSPVNTGVQTSAQTVPPTNAAVPPAQPAPVVVQTRQTPDERKLNIKNMSMEEFQKERQRLQEELRIAASQYATEPTVTGS